MKIFLIFDFFFTKKTPETLENFWIKRKYSGQIKSPLLIIIIYYKLLLYIYFNYYNFNFNLLLYMA